LDHLLEIVGSTILFVTGEVASASLASTGAGIPLALVIQFLLMSFGAVALYETMDKAMEHGSRWWTTAVSSNGDQALLANASREFLRMLVEIALAILAARGLRNNFNNTLTLASAIDTASLLPAPGIMINGDGTAAMSGQGGAGTLTGVQLGEPQFPGPPIAMFANDDQSDSVPSTQGEPGGQDGAFADVGTPTPGHSIRIPVGSSIVVEIMAESDQAEAAQLIRETMSWELPNETAWQIHFEPEGLVTSSAETNTFTLMKTGAQDMLELYEELSGLGDRQPGMLWSVTNDRMFNIAKNFGFQEVSAPLEGFKIVAVRTQDLLALIRANFDQLTRIAQR